MKGIRHHSQGHNLTKFSPMSLCPVNCAAEAHFTTIMKDYERCWVTHPSCLDNKVTTIVHFHYCPTLRICSFVVETQVLTTSTC